MGAAPCSLLCCSDNRLTSRHLPHIIRTQRENQYAVPRVSPPPPPLPTEVSALVIYCSVVERSAALRHHGRISERRHMSGSEGARRACADTRREAGQWPKRPTAGRSSARDPPPPLPANISPAGTRLWEGRWFHCWAAVLVVPDPNLLSRGGGAKLQGMVWELANHQGTV